MSEDEDEDEDDDEDEEELELELAVDDDLVRPVRRVLELVTLGAADSPRTLPLSGVI